MALIRWLLYTILSVFGPPNQSGKIFGRSVEFGWSLVVTNRGKLHEKQGQWVEYVSTYLLEDH